MIGHDYLPHPRERMRRNILSATPQASAARRLLILMVGFVFVYGVVGARMLDIATPSYQVSPIATAQASFIADERKRPTITDRNGNIVAIDIAAASLFADPAKISDTHNTARKLASLLPVDESVIKAKLQNPNKRFVWIARYLTPKQQAVIHNLGLPGVGFKQEYRRVYPHGELFSHILGYANIDNKGLAGLEKFLDQNPNDDSVALSLDMQVQHAVREELFASMREFDARGATATLLDIRNGEVVAMVSLPDFDPNHPMQSPPRNRFNQATLGVYEPGSVVKSFTVAMAIESAGLEPDEIFDASEPMRIGKFSVRDFRPQARPLNIAEILAHSSNIGAAKLAFQVEEQQHRQFWKQLGLLDAATLEVPETGKPITPKKWGRLERATISYGYGVSVSPLQLVSATATLVNGGMRVAPTILHQPHMHVEGERVLSKETSETMRSLLRQVVLSGTGKNADVPAYPVLGKTGTAEKVTANGYDKNKRRTFFLSAFPAQRPQYTLIVMMDEPKASASPSGYATAGWTTAPLTSRIVKRVAPLLGLHPAETHTSPERYAHLIAQP
ncbi:MAG: penicillin-binding protein 2 [Hyphomicrobiales bacterium]|nr:penicillin-binding protein 2 [Hyphomicrobiales bacterium]